MSADPRGPSGTGHDTARIWTPGQHDQHCAARQGGVCGRFDGCYPPGPASVSPAGPTGAELIAAERQRQIAVEGWSPGHDDDEHDSGDLVYAAISYAYIPWSDMRQAPDGDYTNPSGTVAPMTWPWEDEWWKPSPKDRVRELTKAGALIAAEIDRLQRKSDGR